MPNAIKEKIKISVVIPIYQHWSLAHFLFESLSKQTFSSDEWECIIVDNGSDYIPSKGDLPDFVTLLSCSKPGSYAARNKALQYTQGKLIVFTDADCRPTENWLYELWETYKKDECEKIIAGSIEVKVFGNERYSSIEIYDMTLGLPQARYVKNGYAVTANLAIPATIFEVIGGFDETRFSGSDTEFCRRARSLGYSLVYSPKALVYHPARKNWVELETKIRRVKGGQMRSHFNREKIIYILKAFCPPLRTINSVVVNRKLVFKHKFIVIIILLRLWLAGMWEVVMLLTGKEPERR